MKALVAVFLLAVVSAWPAADGVKSVGLRHVAVTSVCAWPNLTLLPDGSIAAVLFGQPSHGQKEGDIECWGSADGIHWERRSRITQHRPNTVRMNHAAGVAHNGDFVVLCSGWTNEKRPERPKQPAFRDAVINVWVLRSKDGGRTWEQHDRFPKAEAGWTEYIPFGDIWRGSNGVLHTSCYQGQFRDPAKSFHTKGWRSWHFYSEDDGRTWKRGSIIGPRHNETDIYPLGKGHWLAAARIDKMELIRSTDNGKSWGKPVPVTTRNEINGHLVRLKDGRLLLSYGVRVKDRRGVCAKFSSDEGKSWSDSVRLSDTLGNADCGYPSSVQLANGKIVTAWYSKHSTEHEGYHMGTTFWQAPPKKVAGRPAQPKEFERAGILKVWNEYAERLNFGKGQTLALIDDGCKMSRPEWQAVMADGRPKVLVTHDAVDGDDDPKHEGRGYHGTTIGIPSSVNHDGKWGVAYNNQIAVIRGNECCHCSIADSRASLARALQWVIDHHDQYRITTINLAPVDDQEHAEPIPTEIDAKLKQLRKLGIWVSAPTGNHKFTKGISWPASQTDCFAIGAVRPTADVVYLDRHEKVALLVPARATSSSNAIACGAAMILREAIEKAGYRWQADGSNLADALMAIFRRTGVPVKDAASGNTFRRLDLAAAVEHVFARN